jgi:hypothetical protein
MSRRGLRPVARVNVTVFGKGGKVRYLPVVDNELRLELERHILDRSPMPDEYLLYPEKPARSSTRGRLE